MKKIQTILFFLFIALFWSCSMLEHDEERGCIFVQLNSGTILSKLNSGSSRGNVSSSVQENFTARLIVTNGSLEIHSTSKAVSENDNLTFSVAGLPVKTVVTVKMQIIGSSGTVYFEGSKDVFVLEGNTPVEIVLNKKFKLCGILNDDEKINRYYDEGEAGILPLKDNEIKFFFVPYETDLTNFDPENFSYVTADEWRWELNGKKLNYGVFSVNPCSVSPATSGLESKKTNVLKCTVKIGEEWYEAVYKFTVSSEPEVVVNKKFKLCGILNDGEKINRYYDEGEAGILPLNNNEIKFFFVSDDTDLTNFDPENFSSVPADEWRWELNGNELDAGVDSVNPCSVSPATSVLEYEKTNVLTCTVKIGEKSYQAVYNFTVEQPVIVNLNTKFKLCGTLYNDGELQHFYNYAETSTLPLNNEIKFFFVPYETDLISFDPNNFSYVPADEWRWELNGKKLDDGFDSVNPCSVSLATSGLEYEKTNVLTCTVKIAEVWYQAVHKFTVEQPAASANYNSYAFYVENKDYYNGYISAYNVDSRFVIPGTGNEIINYKFNVTADAGKTYLYYKESEGANYKIMCSQNKPGMELASYSNLENDTLEGTTVNWLTDSGNTTGQGKLIGKRIAYDSVTKKYWMLGMSANEYYMLSKDSITETAELQHYKMTELINGGPIESLDGEVDFAVYNNYIVLYVKPYETDSTKLHILKINEGDNALEYIAYIDNVSICPLNIELTDIQAVGSDIYLLYGTAISNYNGPGNHSYGFVARLTYDSDDAAAPYKYDNSFGTVGLTANFSKETVIKMSDGYYSDSGSYNEATYFSYYGPTEEDADCSFFSPLYFAAIKDDYLYVIDDGFRKKEDSETGALANRDRLMKVSLKDKTVSVEKDGISLGPGNSSLPNIFEF